MLLYACTNNTDSTSPASSKLESERKTSENRGQPQKRHACIAVNLQGGGGFEIWQYSERKPQPVGFDIAVGDLGVFAAKLNCRDIPACQKALKAKWDAVSDVSALPDGTPCFYVKDLYGNCFQLVQTDYIYIDEGKLTGGMAGTVVGVTDMDKSIALPTWTSPSPSTGKSSATIP